MLNFCIYSDVGNWTLEQFRREIETESEGVIFEICSAGGDVFSALGMIDLVRMRGLKSECNIYGWAASAAGIIALSCDTVRMTSNGTILLHSVWSPDGEIGGKTLDYINSRQLAIIQRRCPSFTMDDLTDETWFDAKACAERGFSDEIIQFDAIAKDNMIARLVAMARPLFTKEAKMDNVKAECGNDKRMEEEKEIKAEDAAPASDDKSMEDVVEKILERLEQMDHRLAVLEGEGKKEDDEGSNLEMVAARVNTLWARACGNPSPVSRTVDGKEKKVADMKKASAIAHEFWK